MLSRRRLLLSAPVLGTAGLGALAGCSRGSSAELEEGDALRMRIWNEAAETAYTTALEAFTDSTGLTVHLEVLSWDEYWKQLPLDVAGGSLPDVLWMNTAQYAQLVEAEKLIEIGALLGDAVSQWEAGATDLYRRGDGLWGVPVMYDRSVLLINDALLEAAGGDPATLRADPAADTDPLRDLARAMTLDAEGLHPGDEHFDAGTRSSFGFSAHPDRTAVLGPFISGQGGAWQDEGETFTFASEQGIAAVQYLADLGGGFLGPDPGTAAGDPEYCRDLFVGGKLGMLQTGTYDLAGIATDVGDAFPWSVHEVVPGPSGAFPLVHATAAVGITTKDDEREKAIGQLLEFLGSADGQRELVAGRLGVPAHRDLLGAWSDAWTELEVDVSAVSSLPETLARPETGLRSAEGTEAALPIIAEAFTGTPAADALPRAQEAAIEAQG